MSFWSSEADVTLWETLAAKSMSHRVAWLYGTPTVGSGAQPEHVNIIDVVENIAGSAYSQFMVLSAAGNGSSYKGCAALLGRHS